jgi:hypothetical protein
MAKKKRRQYQWVYSPPKPPKPKVPEDIKEEVQKKGNKIVEEVFKPKSIKPPPKDKRWNYIIDIYTKWYRNYFYFCATYASPGPNAISPTFEVKFARMEYTENGKFNLAYMRHTGKFWQVDTDLTLDKALQTIQDKGIYHPLS